MGDVGSKSFQWYAGLGRTAEWCSAGLCTSGATAKPPGAALHSACSSASRNLALACPCLLSPPGMNWRDAVVMTWAGLRGAVGLVLALSVRNSDGARACSCGTYTLHQIHALISQPAFAALVVGRCFGSTRLLSIAAMHFPPVLSHL